MLTWLWFKLSICICVLASETYAQNNSLHQVDFQNDSSVHQESPGTSNAFFITTEKKTHLSGMRVESFSPDDVGFVSYNSKEASIVHPNVPVRVVIYGFGMDDIGLIVFTRNPNNCSNYDIEVKQSVFMIQTGKRVSLEASFPQSKDIYYICAQQKPRETLTGEEIIPNFIVMNDIRAGISTEIPPRKYYLPRTIQISLVSFLFLLSGLFSGLNLGLMALTPQELKLIQKSGSKRERAYADVILPVRKSGNLLLCALLLGNVFVNSAISILFDNLTSGATALIVSSAGIVLFGEIFPQSLCVKKGLAVGARTIWITRFFIVLTFPIAYPISKLLDLILGDEVVSYDRKRLMELIKMSTRDEEGLAEELKIAVGAMEISDKTVTDVMTKIDDVFMLPDTTVLNTKTVAEILRMGYTRIPVYSNDRNCVVALLFVKDLALIDPDDNFNIQTVCGFHEHPLRFVMQDTPLRVMLEEFKKGDYHLAMVQRIIESEDSDPNYELVGIVTLEDIVEEILQAEIVDETDVVTDNVNRFRRRGAQQTRDLTACVLEQDGPSRLISVQMQLATIQWLTTNHSAFHQDFISQSILEKLVKQHVRRVEFSHLPEMNDPKAVVPRVARLYTKQESSDRFILILEGRAMVTIGQNEMTFEAGPWYCFGSELFERVASSLQMQSTSDASPTMVSYSRSSLTAIDHLKKPLHFIPDFTAVIRDDCTYLEITTQTYMLAYKSTLLSRGNRDLPIAPEILMTRQERRKSIPNAHYPRMN